MLSPTGDLPLDAGRAAGATRREALVCACGVYTRAYERTGFQGGLNWFRCHAGAIGRFEIELFAGRTIDVPACIVSGVAEWGTYRKPGAVERMKTTPCSRMDAVHLVEGAGHWVQQEQPDRFNAVVLDFLRRKGSTR